MNKRLYVDFHILQTVPPSCINRDDTGSPKTAVYGGVTRARVSSQAWKHAMRDAFAENARLDVGKRTKKVAELVKEQILALAPEADADKLAKKALENAGIKSDDKGTKALFFMSTAQAKALAELAVAGSTNKKEYQKALGAAPSMDMALFGRMVADDPSLNYDAAAQVAHSISTHAVQNEYDYFTAVDDCQAEDNAGAGHLGTVEYNSSTLYRYATVNVMELAGQLGAEQAAETVRAFGEAFLFSMPTGKQNSFANRTLPDAVYVTIREDQPVNLCGAFERAVPRSTQVYRKASKDSGVPWSGRLYRPEDFASGDAVNQALSAGHACLYGLAHAVIVALGCAPGLGFVHVGHECSFVYDIADLYKAEVTIPIAFEVAAQAPEDLPAVVRRRVRDAMVEHHILERMVHDIRYLLLNTDEPEQEPEVVYLWDDRIGTVANGINYFGKEEGEEPS